MIRNAVCLRNSGGTLDQPIKSTIRYVKNEFSHKLVNNSFRLTIRFSGDHCAWNVFLENRAVNSGAVRMFMMRIRMMVVRRRAVIIGRGINLLAVRPSRSQTGEKHGQTASDDDQPFHCELPQIALWRKHFQEAAICFETRCAVSPNFPFCGTCGEQPDTYPHDNVIFEDYRERVLVRKQGYYRCIVSFMRSTTMRPEVKVTAAISQIAAWMPSASAVRPATRAPTA